MIALSKQQCGNCRNGRMLGDLVDCRLASRIDADQIVQGANYWCSGWELHPDYYEIFGFPSEAEQLEQQRMLMFPGTDAPPSPELSPDVPYTYD